MESFEDLDELAISLDIIARLTLVTMASSIPTGEAEKVFDSISKSLCEVYDQEKVKKLINTYKGSVAEFKKVLEVL